MSTIPEITVAMVSCFSFLYIVYSNRETYKLQKELKSIDITIEYQNRYDCIRKEIEGIDYNNIYLSNLENNPVAYDHLLKFWIIQHEQWQYFCDGYIKQSIYKYWIEKRKKEYNNHSISPIERNNYEQIQDFILSKINDNKFSEFVKQLRRDIPVDDLLMFCFN